MPRLLKEQGFVGGAWRRLDTWPPSAADDESLLFPLAVWHEHRAALLARDPARTGVWLNGDEEPDPIAADIPRLTCIAINFPAFMDGRGFSCGRLLRQRYGFQGELRAVGDVMVDHLHYLRRCGFDAFELPDDTELDTALGCLNAFSVHYQAAHSN